MHDDTTTAAAAPADLDRRWRRLAAVPAVAGALLILYLVFLGSQAQLLGCLKDDGYYYLTIARHAAAGEGFTFDGLGPTNGFHPLWEVLLTPLLLLPWASPFGAVRAAILLALAVHLAAAWAVRRGARRLAGPAVGDLCGWLYAGNPLALWLVVSGMESPLAALCVALLGAESVALQNGTARLDRRRDVLRVGLLGGLCLLARTELALLTGLVLLAAVAVAPAPNWWRRLRGGALAGAISLAVTAPWLGWNLWRFGSVVQVSARAHRLHAASLRDAYAGPAGGGESLGQRLLHIQQESLLARLPVPGGVVVLLELAVVGVLLWWAWSLLADSDARRAAARRAAWFAAPVAYAVGFVAAAFLVLGHFRSWYVAGPLAVAATGAALPLLLAAWPRALPRGGRAAARVVAAGYAVGMLALGPVFLREIAAEAAITNCWTEAAAAVADLAAPGERVASFNSGTFGYLSPRTVVNLDCVVNNRALPFLATRRLPAFLAENRIRFVVDDPDYVRRYFRVYSRDGWQAHLAVRDTLPSGLVVYEVR